MVPPMGPGISAGAMFALSLRKIINKLIQLRSQCYHPVTVWKTYQRCRSYSDSPTGKPWIFHGFSWIFHIYERMDQFSNVNYFKEDPKIPMDQSFQVLRHVDTVRDLNRAILVLL
jgi:hypothetical protein